MTLLKKAVSRSSCVLAAALIVGGVSPIRSDRGAGTPSCLVAVEHENDLPKMLLQKLLLSNGE